MKTKLGPNDLCPCGSGKKVKKCCKLQRTVTRYTQLDRLALLDALDHFIDMNLAEQEDQHYDDFWGVFLEREDELPRELISASSEVQFMSFSCDWEVEPQTTALDLLLAQHTNLSLGARAFARALRSSTLRLYEVTSVVPGVSLTLRDLLEDGEVTIAEKTASRTLNRYDWLAARVVESGCSGQPEIEQGIMVIPSLQRDRLHAQLVQLRASAVAEGELKAFQRDLPALIHAYWVGSVLEPQIPELHNTDGEPLLITHVHFDVLDRAQLERALDAHKSLSREDERWSWSGTNAHGTEVSLGSIELRGESLVLEATPRRAGSAAHSCCVRWPKAQSPRARLRTKTPRARSASASRADAKTMPHPIQQSHPRSRKLSFSTTMRNTINSGSMSPCQPSTARLPEPRQYSRNCDSVSSSSFAGSNECTSRGCARARPPMIRRGCGRS